jgi:branched-chain amino acid transport system permease protein
MTATLERSRASRSRMPKLLTTPILLMAVTAAVLLIAGASSSSPILQGATATAGIDVVLAVGLYTLSGTTGIISFGFMGPVMIGAYAAAIFASDPILKASTMTTMPHWLVNLHTGVVPAILIGAIASGIFAAISSVPLVRLAALAASLASFAVLVVVYTVATNWTAVTGGVNGYTAVPLDTTTDKALVWALIAIIIGFWFKESKTGLRLRAARDDEAAALAVGINVRRDRLVAFTLSGFLLGIGGALTGLQTGGFTPSVFYLDATLLILVMVVIGGVNSLSGAVLGSLFVSAAGYTLQLAQSGNVLGVYRFGGRAGIETGGLAIIALLVLAFRPSGIFGNAEISDAVASVFRRRTKEGNWRAKDQIKDRASESSAGPA